MRTLPICLLAGLVSASSADVVVFHNDNPNLDRMDYGYYYDGYYFPTLLPKDMIDLTRDASAQPITSGYPAHSVGISATEPGTSSADAEIHVIVANQNVEPLTSIVLTPDAVPYISPNWGSETRQVIPFDFTQGGTVDASSNWGGETPSPGLSNYFGSTVMAVFSYGTFDNVTMIIEPRFTVAVRFALNGAEHYGFAEFDSYYGESDGLVRRQFIPIRWGYETEPNTPLVIPASCVADVAMPFGALNFFDVVGFLDAYNSGAASADVAEPFGALNFFDIAEYIALFNAGCP